MSGTGKSPRTPKHFRLTPSIVHSDDREPARQPPSVVAKQSVQTTTSRTPPIAIRPRGAETCLRLMTAVRSGVNPPRLGSGACACSCSVGRATLGRQRARTQTAYGWKRSCRSASSAASSASCFSAAEIGSGSSGGAGGVIGFSLSTWLSRGGGAGGSACVVVWSMRSFQSSSGPQSGSAAMMASAHCGSAVGARWKRNSRLR